MLKSGATHVSPPLTRAMLLALARAQQPNNGEGPSGQPAVAVLHALKELECLVVSANGELLAYQIHLEMLESTYYTQTLFLNCSMPLLSWEKFPPRNSMR